jgi:hypothetical protein
MDRTMWRKIVWAIRKVDGQVPRVGRRCRYSDKLVVKLWLWAVWHDRPLYWACQRSHCSGLFRPRRLPSVSQFSRRLRTTRVQKIVRLVNEVLCGTDRPIRVMYFDGKALPVSESTQDRQAKTGRGNGRFSRGYKLHALGDETGRIRGYCVRSLNEGEPRIARCLSRRVQPETLVLADANYDSNRLYAAIRRRQAFLFTPQKGRTLGKGKRRQMCAARRCMIDLWERFPRLCKKVYKVRSGIERIFSALSSFAGGLGPLPSWVRGLRRVRQWVTAKLAIYHARLILREARA